MRCPCGNTARSEGLLCGACLEELERSERALDKRKAAEIAIECVRYDAPEIADALDAILALLDD